MTPRDAPQLGRVLVVGAGALGCYFAAMLAKSGTDVVVLARGHALQSLRSVGVRIEGLSGDFSVRPSIVTDELSQIGPIDHVLLAVKAWQVAQTARALKPNLGPKSKVLTLQNGIEAPDEVSVALGPDRTLVGVCRIFCSVLAPGHVRHSGLSPSLVLGEFNGAALSNESVNFAVMLRDAGIEVDTDSDAREALWSKLVLLSSLAGMGSVTGLPIGSIRTHPESRAMMRELMLETANVAAQCGVRLPASIIDDTMSFLMKMPADAESSMQRDVAQGRPSEYDAIIGAIVRKAALCRVPVPAMRHVYACLSVLHSSRLDR